MRSCPTYDRSISDDFSFSIHIHKENREPNHTIIEDLG